MKTFKRILFFSSFAFSVNIQNMRKLPLCFNQMRAYIYIHQRTVLLRENYNHAAHSSRNVASCANQSVIPAEYLFTRPHLPPRLHLLFLSRHLRLLFSLIREYHPWSDLSFSCPSLDFDGAWSVSSRTIRPDKISKCEMDMCVRVNNDRPDSCHCAVEILADWRRVFSGSHSFRASASFGTNFGRLIGSFAISNIVKSDVISMSFRNSIHARK